MPDPLCALVQQYPWFQRGMPANLDVDAYNSLWGTCFVFPARFSPPDSRCAPAQQHPWFQQGMPANLDVDAYNSYWVNLSREAPDNSAAIKV